MGLILKKVLALSCGALVMLFTSVCAPVAEAASGLHDKEFACVPKIEELMRTDVFKLAGRRSPGSAWKLVNTFLCGASPGAEHFLVKASAKIVIDRSEGPSGLEEKPVQDSLRFISEQLPHAKAWNPEVSLEGQDLVVHYTSGPFCWNSFGLRFNNGIWQLVLLGKGCI
jgi:hypothetical protein